MVTRYIAYATAVLFMLAVPRGLSAGYEVVILTAGWLLMLIMTVMLYRARAGQIALATGILAIFYNPMFIHDPAVDRSIILDLAVSMVFFMIALYWPRIITSSHPNHHD